MSIHLAAWLTLATTLLFLVYRDENVAIFLVLQTRAFQTYCNRLMYGVWHNPEMFWRRYLIYRDNEQRARCLAKQLGLDNNNDWNDDHSN